jgi:HEAT repeat protein
MNKHWQTRLTVIAALAFAVLVLNSLLNLEPKFLGKTASSWVKALGSPKTDKAPAIHALVRMGPEAALPALTSALRSKGTPLYRNVWQLFPNYLKQRLPNPEDKLNLTRYHALVVLKQFGPSASAAIPSVVDMLHDPNPKLRHWVVDVLAEVGANDASAVAALQTMLQDKDLMVRNAAQAALAKMPVGEQQETPPR